MVDNRSKLARPLTISGFIVNGVEQLVWPSHALDSWEFADEGKRPPRGRRALPNPDTCDENKRILEASCPSQPFLFFPAVSLVAYVS